MAASPKMHKLELFYDVVSPYSLFAFQTLIALIPVWSDVQIELIPVSLGHIMKVACYHLQVSANSM